MVPATEDGGECHCFICRESSIPRLEFIGRRHPSRHSDSQSGKLKKSIDISSNLEVEDDYQQE